MSDLHDIEALGVELPKTRAVIGTEANTGRRRTPSQWTAAVFELLAVIERLAADNDSIDKAYKERYQQYLDTKKRAEQAEADLAAARERHCEDCCCAQSWRALGISECNGKDIPEHISALRAALAEAYGVIERALSWEGVLEFIDRTYPAKTFTGASGDPGPRLIVLLRELKRVEAELAAAREEARKWEWVARDIAGAFDTKDAILADALARYCPAGAKPQHRHSPDPLRNHGYTDICRCGAKIHRDGDGWAADSPPANEAAR